MGLSPAKIKDRLGTPAAPTTAGRVSRFERTRAVTAALSVCRCISLNRIGPVRSLTNGLLGFWSKASADAP